MREAAEQCCTIIRGETLHYYTTVNTTVNHSEHHSEHHSEAYTKSAECPILNPVVVCAGADVVCVVCGVWRVLYIAS